MSSDRFMNSSIFICYSTPNYERLTDMCLSSLRDAGAKHIDHLLDNPSKELLSATGFQTPLWYYATKQKMVHLVNTLKKLKGSSDYKYFVFTDCDIIFIKRNAGHWQNLEDHINRIQDKDLFFMKEKDTADVNTGFCIIKNNENIDKVIAFFEEVVDIFINSNTATLPYGDQSIINRIKNKINYDRIPNEYVVFGDIVFDYNRALFHHAIGCSDIYDKIHQIHFVKSLLGI